MKAHTTIFILGILLASRSSHAGWDSCPNARKRAFSDNIKSCSTNICKVVKNNCAVAGPQGPKVSRAAGVLRVSRV